MDNRKIKTREDLIHLIQNGKLEECIKQIIALLKTTEEYELYKEITIQSERYHSNENRNNRGILTLTEYEINKGKILVATLSIIEKIPDELFFFRKASSAVSKKPKAPLYLRIYREKLWDELEQIAINAVLLGGTTAMGYYREAWSKTQSISGEEKNPSTNADLQATISILRSLGSRLIEISRKVLKCDLLFWGEETNEEILKGVKGSIAKPIREKIISESGFFSENTDSIRVIFDAIDGTSSFSRGFPLFCSAVAFIIGDIPRVSAIYDPVHHTVYSAVLKGEDDAPEEPSTAYAWHISIGNRIKLKEILKNQNSQTEVNNEPIGVHFSRSSKNRYHLRKFLGVESLYSFEEVSRMSDSKINFDVLNAIESEFDEKGVYTYQEVSQVLSKINEELEIEPKLFKTQRKLIFDKFVRTHPTEKNIFENLAIKTGGIYALNSGLFAMSEVARGALGGFVNIITNPWDVAAGEVLINAINGKVSNFNNEKINYNIPGPVSLVSARTKEIHQYLMGLINSTK